jgi:hypothetical protein
MEKSLRAILLLAGVGLCGTVFADEGMWTFDNFPVNKMHAQ